MKNNMNQLSVGDLKEGDVLLFSVLSGDLISSLIGLLTQSDVSHAALFADAAHRTILEATGDSPVLENEAEPRFKNRRIYVCRERSSLNLAPVIAAGRRHVDKKTPYGGIYTLGLLLITSRYARIHWDEKTSQAVVTLLASTYYLLRSWLERDDPNVFCSQFVDQCFEEAGEHYRLHFDSGTVIPLADEASPSLLDCVAQTLDSSAWENALSDDFAVQSVSPGDEEEACLRLLDAIGENEEELTAGNWKPDWKLLVWTARVAYAWFCLLTHQKSWKSFWSPAELKKAIDWLEKHRSCMIAPCDFRRAEELEEIGYIQG